MWSHRRKEPKQPLALIHLDHHSTFIILYWESIEDVGSSKNPKICMMLIVFHLSLAMAVASTSSCCEDRTYVRGAAGVTVRQLESLVRHPKLDGKSTGFHLISPKMVVFIVLL